MLVSTCSRVMTTSMHTTSTAAHTPDCLQWGMAEAHQRPPVHVDLAGMRMRRTGLSSIRVLTNNPMKLVGLEGYGLEIVGRLPIVPPASDENRSYLDVKRDKLGHLLTH